MVNLSAHPPSDRATHALPGGLDTRNGRHAQAKHEYHHHAEAGLDTLFVALPAGLRVFERSISSVYAKGERRRKGGHVRLLPHPATREEEVEALVQRTFELVAARLEISSDKIGVLCRRYHRATTRKEGTAVVSLQEASVKEFMTASAVDRVELEGESLSVISIQRSVKSSCHFYRLLVIVAVLPASDNH